MSINGLSLAGSRTNRLHAYKNDCCLHCTAPSLLFSAMLRMTKTKLDLITDSDQILMVESAISGGLWFSVVYFMLGPTVHSLEHFITSIWLPRISYRVS